MNNHKCTHCKFAKLWTPLKPTLGAITCPHREGPEHKVDWAPQKAFAENAKICDFFELNEYLQKNDEN
jgi:hypothetical protein